MAVTFFVSSFSLDLVINSSWCEMMDIVWSFSLQNVYKRNCFPHLQQCRQQQVKWKGKIYVSKIGLVAVNGREMEDLSWNSNIVSVALQLFAFKFWIYINQSINNKTTRNLIKDDGKKNYKLFK